MVTRQNGGDFKGERITAKEKEVVAREEGVVRGKGWLQ